MPHSIHAYRTTRGEVMTSDPFSRW